MKTRYQSPALDILIKEIAVIDQHSQSAHTHLIRLLVAVSKLTEENAQNIFSAIFPHC